MENPILEAAEKADETALRAWEDHVLTPFHAYGIHTFAGLRSEFEKRDKVYVQKLREDQDAVAAKALTEQKEVARKQLTAAGIKVTDTILESYCAIADDKIRENFVKDVLSKNISSTRVTEATGANEKKNDAAAPKGGPVGSIMQKLGAVTSRFTAK